MTAFANNEPSPATGGADGKLAFGFAEDPLFKAIFLQSPEAIALTRARDNTIVAVNEEWLALTGFSRDKVLGRTAVEIGHWPDESARQQALQPLASEGRVCDLDITMVLANGAHRLMCMNAVLVDVQAESFVLFYLRDVTTDRMARAAVLAGEQALAQSNENLNRQVELYQLTESMAKVGYGVVYPGDSRVHLSHGYREICHLDADHVSHVGDHLQRVLADDLPIVKRALATMNGEIVEYRWRRPDGQVIWLRSRLQRRMENGVVKAEIGIVQDISGEREALQSAAEQLAVAQRSEARFRSLSELSSDWYWEQDAEFRFVRMDGDADVFRAMPVEQYIGLTRWDSGAEGVSPAQWEAHRALLRSHAVFHDFELCRRRADGSIVWMSVSGAPFFDDQGTFLGYRGTGRDISARKQAKDETAIAVVSEPACLVPW